MFALGFGPKSGSIGNLIFNLSGFILILLSGSRWERGTDWQAYYEHFHELENPNFVNVMEPGFTLLTHLGHLLGLNYTLFLLLISSIIYIQVFNFIQKFSPFKNLSVLTLWCLGLGIFFFVRQTLALSFLLTAIIFLINGKQVKFFAFLIVASSFHYSAVIFLLVYALKSSFSFKGFLTSVFIVGIVGLVVFLQNEAYTNKFLIYTDSEYISLISEQLGSSLMTRLFSVLNRLAILLILFRYLYGISSVYDFFIRIYLMGSVLFCISELSIPVIGRLVMYFDVFLIILIPALFAQIKRVDTKVIFWILLLIYLISRFYRSLTGPYVDLYIPYNSFLTKEIPMVVF
jgi:hypothetical protein